MCSKSSVFLLNPCYLISNFNFYRSKINLAYSKLFAKVDDCKIQIQQWHIWVVHTHVRYIYIYQNGFNDFIVSKKILSSQNQQSSTKKSNIFSYACSKIKTCICNNETFCSLQIQNHSRFTISTSIDLNRVCWNASIWIIILHLMCWKNVQHYFCIEFGKKSTYS